MRSQAWATLLALPHRGWYDAHCWVLSYVGHHTHTHVLTCYPVLLVPCSQCSFSWIISWGWAPAVSSPRIFPGSFHIFLDHLPCSVCPHHPSIAPPWPVHGTVFPTRLRAPGEQRQCLPVLLSQHRAQYQALGSPQQRAVTWLNGRIPAWGRSGDGGIFPLVYHITGINFISNPDNVNTHHTTRGFSHSKDKIQLNNGR